MKYVFLSAYGILGVVKPPVDADVLLFEQDKPQTRVIVTSQIAKYWLVLDRQTALASMLLMGFVGESLSAEFDAKLEEKISAVSQRRSESVGSDGILVVEMRGDIDADIKEPKRVIRDFVVCFDAYNKKQLHSQLQDRIASILVALRIGGPRSYELENIGTGSYLIGPDGKIVHSFSIELGSPTAYVSSPITAEQVGTLRDDISLIFADENVKKVVRLFAHSLERSVDNFRSFLSAWSAIEIFIGKVFPIYQETLISDLLKTNSAPGLRQYLERISDVMKDKYTLIDKFAVISIYLSKEEQESDINTFKVIKKIRDQIFHGEEIPEATLPLKELQAILDKYIRSHLRMRLTTG